MDDKVLNAFDKASTDYDKYRNYAIPNMDIYYTTVIKLTKNYQNPKILDLGAGTGILTQLLYKQHPNSNITLFDLSNKMLNIARSKFTNQNFKYVEGNYLDYEFTEKYDVIVSSLSIHHLTDNEKRIMYEKIFNTLEYGGIFINADLSLGETEYTEKLYKIQDSEYLDKHPLPEEEKKEIKNRRKLDKPSKISDMIRWYSEIGFKNVDIYYKYYRYFVLAGEK